MFKKSLFCDNTDSINIFPIFASTSMEYPANQSLINESQLDDGYKNTFKDGSQYKFTKQDELSALTDSYRQAIKFWVEDPNDFLGEDQCVYTGVIPYIGSKRITLAYVAATQADADLIASYLPEAHEDETPIQPDELPNSLPAYLIKVKPQLMIDGEVVATGKPVTMGLTQEFFMRYLYPTRVGDPAEIIQNEIIAGAVYVVTLNTGKVALEKINQHKTTFEKIQKNLENKIVDQIQPESLSGELLQIIGLMYFYTSVA